MMSDIIMLWIFLLLAISVLPLTILLLWWLLERGSYVPSVPPSLGLLPEQTCVEAQEWTRESLRKAILDGSDKIRGSIVWRYMNSQQRLLSSCGRTFWASNTPTTNAALDAYVQLLKEAGE